MDRSLWLQHLDKDNLPTWPSPACSKGHVSDVRRTFAHKETAASVRAKGSPDWAPRQFVRWRFRLTAHDFAFRFIGAAVAVGVTPAAPSILSPICSSASRVWSWPIRAYTSVVDRFE